MTALATLALTLLINASTLDDTGIVVSLKGAAVEIRGVRVLLQDIATIDVFTDSDREPAIRARLLRLEIGRAPQGATTFVVDRKTIQDRIVAAGFDAASVTVDGAANVTVTTRTVRVDAERVEQLLRKRLRESIGAEADRASLRIVGAYRPFDAPVGRFRTEFEISEDPRNALWVGQLRPELVVRVDGEEVRREPVSILVRRPLDVVKVKRRVARGRVLGIDDVEIVETEIDGNIGALITDLASALGRRTLEELDAGALLDDRRLQSLPVIRKGDVVTARLAFGGIVAETICRASEDGGRGDRIELVNVDSQESVYAVVIDARTVEVQAGVKRRNQQ